MVELSAGASIALGVLVGLASTSVQSVGLTLQRKSHLLEDEKEHDDERRPPYKRRRWQLGMLMFIVANLVGSTIQITTLPLPVLSTLQASGLVFNSICASVILSEPFTRYSFIGTMLVAAGALLIALFGAIAEPSHTLDQLLALLGRKHFLVWMLSTAIVVVFLIVATWLLKRMYPRPTPHLRLVRGMFFGCVSGILSAHSLLIAKSAVELLVRTIVDRHNQFDRWQSWMILIGLVAFALTQLYYMHRGLKLVSTSVLYPLVFCVYNIIAIIDGLIYFHQSDRLSALHAGLIALGTVILLAGVVCLSWRLEDAEEEPDSPLLGKHIDGVPLPQTVLQPGLGLVHGHVTEEADSPLGTDIEHTPSRAANERTPLLGRSASGPARTLTTQQKKRQSLEVRHHGDSRASPSPRRASGKRRVTLSEDTGEIWDELNDRDAFPSPIRRSADLERPRSGTLPSRKTNTFCLARSDATSQGKTSINSSASFLNHPDPDDGDDSDNGVMDTTRRSGTWNYGGQRSKSQDGLGDWLKLTWWRKRWRDDEDSEEPTS
ncbi:hypothetical protein T440DRAFT_500893 [Plenodomus tracheiphilus IPT5]|uniref:DUF803-domain-containing protein n=1 Tax=Plenodomus tracheiphilus IPT5 TaxID=1408161 RepID=A0A6A7AX50_9PLEO|nr:hypothetical protein T440DRAFT_500893 [Plenodomus tracheiphilus IPT5]